MLFAYLLLLVLQQVATFTVSDPFALVAAASSNNNNFAVPVAAQETHFKSATILTATEFESFTRSIDLIEDIECQHDLNHTLWGIINDQRWAVIMYDATVKSAVGIESGLLYQFGHYDECLSPNILHETAGSHEIPVRAKYCLANVTLDGRRTMHGVATRNKQLTNQTIAHWGACVPASCSASDVAIFLEQLLQRSVAVEEGWCQVRASKLHVTNAMFSYALVIFFFMFLTLLSTTYHACMLYKRKNDEKPQAFLRNETLQLALLSFSIIENSKKMFQVSKDQLGLNSINGIKAIAMVLILAGHAMSFIYGGPVYNAEFIEENIKRPGFGFLSNSLLFVDTFLLLSSFLFCRILLIELERRRGKLNVLILYVARYIRLTPAYMAIIGFYMTWFPHAGEGPIWQQRIVREQERCTASWWLNILYINNYINTDKLCMFQSWYLSVDSQLFFAAPIVIYLLYRSRKQGLRLLIALVVLTAAIPFIATYLKNLDPTLMVYADEMNDLASNIYYVGSYIKTHMRASAYAVGLLTGYLVHLMQEKSTKIPSPILRCIWFLAIFVGTASMCAVSRFYWTPFNNLESTMYAGFHKLGWNLSVGWLVLAVTTGHGGWLQEMLKSRVFAPLSRLTYCAYLSNGIVELYHSSSIRTVSFMGYISLTNDVVSHIVDTFLLAFIVCLLFESPIHALERILLRKLGGAKQRQDADKNESRTPSTSEEQVA